MQICQALNGVSQGLLINSWIFGPEAVTDGAVGNGGKFKIANLVVPLDSATILFDTGPDCIVFS